MKIVIVGDGKVGVALTEQLTKEGHDVTIIDNNPQVLEESQEIYDVMVVHGNGACMSVLKEAEISSADLLIAATSGDEINLLTCIVAKKLGNLHTIARVRNPEYSEQLIFLQDELGLSMTINPELAAARETYHLLQFPGFLKRDSFAKGRVEIVEIKINESSKLCNIALNKLYEIAKVKVLVCAVERGNSVHIPNGDFILAQGDKIYVTAGAQDLAELMKHLGLQKEKIRNVLIIGGSRIAIYLAARLLRGGIGVKIIEQNPTRCLELANILPNATIIEGDGSRQDVLLSEGIQDTDALVTLTNMDEENLIISMYGNHLGVPKIITKINRTEYIEIFKDMGIDSVISPKQLCSNDIVRYVRAMENRSGGSVITLHKIVNGKAEALEFQATGSTRYLNQSLSSLNIKKDIILACITRRGKTIIPKGDDIIQCGDSVVVVTTQQQAIHDLNDLFEK